MLFSIELKALTVCGSMNSQLRLLFTFILKLILNYLTIKLEDIHKIDFIAKIFEYKILSKNIQCCIYITLMLKITANVFKIHLVHFQSFHTHLIQLFPSTHLVFWPFYFHCEK